MSAVNSLTTLVLDLRTNEYLKLHEADLRYFRERAKFSRTFGILSTIRILASEP